MKRELTPSIDHKFLVSLREGITSETDLILIPEKTFAFLAFDSDSFRVYGIPAISVDVDDTDILFLSADDFSKDL